MMVLNHGPNKNYKKEVSKTSLEPCQWVKLWWSSRSQTSMNLSRTKINVSCSYCRFRNVHERVSPWIWLWEIKTGRLEFRIQKPEHKLLGLARELMGQRVRVHYVTPFRLTHDRRGEESHMLRITYNGKIITICKSIIIISKALDTYLLI